MTGRRRQLTDKHGGDQRSVSVMVRLSVSCHLSVCPGRSDVTAVSSVPSARCCPPQRVSDAPRRGRAAFGLFEAATPRPPCGRSRGRTPLYISRMIIKTVTYRITGRQYTPGGGGVTFLSELQRASRSDRETMSQI